MCGSKLPNGWGIFDAHGNVYEWCQDWHDKTYRKEDRLTDPTGPAYGDEHILRGGAFDYEPKFATSSIRAKARPTYLSPTIGFRPVKPSASD